MDWKPKQGLKRNEKNVANINTTIVAGNMVKDPNVKRLDSGAVVASFTLAANHYYRDRQGQAKEETAFMPCVAFGRQAERAAARRKGQPVCASGYLRTDQWEHDGKPASRLVLMCAEVQGLVCSPPANNPGSPLSTPPPDPGHPPF
jgi:single-strand DNA-binding protein